MNTQPESRWQGHLNNADLCIRAHQRLQDARQNIVFDLTDGTQLIQLASNVSQMQKCSTEKRSAKRERLILRRIRHLKHTLGELGHLISVIVCFRRQTLVRAEWKCVHPAATEP